ncbi:anti-sigma factor [Yimella sp. cx-573]|nr:anti-sigma factor [Yimella sp. cx-573]
MQHPSDDELVDLVMETGEHQGALLHVRECAECSDALTELRRALDAAAAGTPVLETPGEHVWQGILAEIDDVGSDAAGPGGHDLDGDMTDRRPFAVVGGTPPSANATAPARSDGDDRAKRGGGRRRTFLAVAAALVIGAGIGRLTASPTNDPPTTATVVAKTSLTTLGDAPKPLGQAELMRSGSATKVQIAMNSLPSNGEIVEAWLINKDGQRMISIGFVHGAKPQQFVIDPRLVQEGYVIVDLSREPLDGNPKHSGDSIVRGTLPV